MLSLAEGVAGVVPDDRFTVRQTADLPVLEPPASAGTGTGSLDRRPLSPAAGTHADLAAKKPHEPEGDGPRHGL